MAKTFGGVPSTAARRDETTLCKCGLTNTCDRKKNEKKEKVNLCNCDANDNVWRYDDGYIEDKAFLPVAILLAGDTGRKLAPIEMRYSGCMWNLFSIYEQI